MRAPGLTTCVYFKQQVKFASEFCLVEDWHGPVIVITPNIIRNLVKR